ncbi:MAG TPA: SurA N-terminal domain-containing protein [Usitatibacter sp.]|nr:SurA N-terminal domain-containing protein [Usitatibacter sp.]
MLQNIRDFAGNRIVRWLFIIFLVVPFGLFGIDAYINRVGSDGAVAHVGKARVTNTEFENALRRQADMYREQFRGQFDNSIMDNPEIRRAVLDQLVNEKLIALGAERSGLRIPDAALAERISRIPEFQVEGQFNKDRYAFAAKSQGMTPVAFDERLRQIFRLQEFRDSIAETTIVPKATIETFIKLSEQSREVSVVNLAPETYLAKVKISPEQVKAYYDANAAEFTTPESARVEYVELSVDALAAKAEVPAEEVQRAYEDGMKRNQWGQPEERRASHILVTAAADAKEADRKAAEAKAKEIAERVRKAPKTFADVAKKESQDPGSAAQGGDLGFFVPSAMVKPFADAVFAAKKGDIVGPVASEFGYHVILVTDIKPAKMKTLAEATPEIEATLKKQVAQRMFAESAEQFSNLVYEQSSSLQPAADALKLQVKQSPWISKGAPGFGPLASPKITAEIFSDNTLKAKRNTSAVEVAPGTLVAAHVIEHKAAELKPLEAVKADIERKLAREEALKLARQDGEAKLKELTEGKDAGVKWPAPLAVNRQKPGGLFPQVIDKAFRADSKKLPTYLGVETPAGYSLVQVNRVIEVEKVDAGVRDRLAQQLKQSVAAEELEATLDALRDDVGVTVRREALEKKASP